MSLTSNGCADWNINDKWRIYGRASRLHTMVDANNITPNNSIPYVTPGASARHAFSASGDAIWTVSPTTLINFHGDYHSLVDDYDSPRDKLDKDGWSKIWGNNKWWAPFGEGIPPYVPRFTIHGSQFGIAGVYWYQHPNGNTFNAKFSQQRGAHYWKAGSDTRRSGGVSLVTGTTNFAFGPALTADTFISPNTRYVGHDYATFLLGALDTGSQALVKPVKEPRTEFYALYLQDDWKLARNLTLNLGLRYEYGTPWHDPQYRMSIGLDVNDPHPEMQKNPPRISPEVTRYMDRP